MAQDKIVENTKTGSIVTITDAYANYPAIDIQADIVAVQPNDYDSVWVGGAGKNKLPNNLTSGSGSGLTWTVNADGSIKITGTASATEDIEIYNSGNEAQGLQGSFILNGSTGGSSYTYRIACRIRDTSANTNRYVSAPNGDLSVSTSASEVINRVYIPVNSGTALGTSGKVFYPMLRLSSVSDATFEPYSNICPISGFTEVKVYVSPTTQQADATVYTIDLDGTRYGGTLDVTSGVLTVTHKAVDLGTLSWTYKTQGYFDGYLASVVNEIKRPSSGSELVGIISSQYVENTSNQIYNATNDGVIAVRYSNGDIWVRDTSQGTNATTFKTNMSGVTAVYELATPLTVNLTAQEIELLQGANNVWASSGDVTVKYATTSSIIPLKIYAGASAGTLALLPSPVSIKNSRELIWSENTGRAQSGSSQAKMIGDVVAQKKTYEIKWGIIEESDYNTIVNKLTGGFFNFGMGYVPTNLGRFYRSEIQGELLPIGTKLYYKDVSVSVIEQ